jgi:hypothetical protein
MENSLSNLRFNEKVTLTGVYTKSIIANRGPGEHQGHYKVIINDTLEVILLPPYHQEAIRPEEEVQLYEGKKVIVTGIISERTLLSRPSLESQPQSINIPCFVTIDDIHLVEE